MGTPVWSGYLTFGIISIPVRLYSGARRKRVPFRMLHRDTQAPIEQQLYSPPKDRVIARDEVVKGFEFRKDEYIAIEPAEIQQVQPKTGRAMEITEFIAAGEIDPIYFDASYYIMPEAGGERPYAVLAKAMEKMQSVGISTLDMHNRDYTLALRAHAGAQLPFGLALAYPLGGIARAAHQGPAPSRHHGAR